MEDIMDVLQKMGESAWEKHAKEMGWSEEQAKAEFVKATNHANKTFHLLKEVLGHNSGALIVAGGIIATAMGKLRHVAEKAGVTENDILKAAAGAIWLATDEGMEESDATEEATQD